jgi:hypothetical protein
LRDTRHESLNPQNLGFLPEQVFAVRYPRRTVVNSNIQSYEGVCKTSIHSDFPLGESGYALLKTIPDAVLGGLLLFSGIELALSAKLQEHEGEDLFLVLLMAAIGVALNPAAAFAVGLPTAYAFKRGWLSLHTG